MSPISTKFAHEQSFNQQNNSVCSDRLSGSSRSDDTEITVHTSNEDHASDGIIGTMEITDIKKTEKHIEIHSVGSSSKENTLTRSQKYVKATLTRKGNSQGSTSLVNPGLIFAQHFTDETMSLKATAGPIKSDHTSNVDSNTSPIKQFKARDSINVQAKSNVDQKNNTRMQQLYSKLSRVFRPRSTHHHEVDASKPTRVIPSKKSCFSLTSCIPFYKKKEKTDDVPELSSQHTLRNVSLKSSISSISVSSKISKPSKSSLSSATSMSTHHAHQTDKMLNTKHSNISLKEKQVSWKDWEYYQLDTCDHEGLTLSSVPSWANDFQFLGFSEWLRLYG
jgi:hypothetical protein